MKRRLYKVIHKNGSELTIVADCIIHAARLYSDCKSIEYLGEVLVLNKEV